MAGKETGQSPQKRIEALHQTVVNFAEQSDNFIFVIDVERNGRLLHALTSFDDNGTYVDRVYFWPEMKDRKMSSRALIIEDDHLGEDNSYNESAIRELFVAHAMPRLPFRVCEEINPGIVNIASFGDYGRTRLAHISDAVHLLGTIDHDSIRELP